MIAVPFLFPLIAAYRAGTMTGFYHRYASLGIPFGAMYTAWFIVRSFKIKPVLGYAVLALGAGQLLNWSVTLRQIYRDGPQQYAVIQGRKANPYYQIAQDIQKQYQPGDTVLYPSLYVTGLSGAVTESVDFDNADAQLVNLYLPPTATYIQRISRTEPDQVVLQKASGQRVVLFDFKGKTYRY